MLVSKACLVSGFVYDCALWRKSLAKMIAPEAHLGGFASERLVPPTQTRKPEVVGHFAPCNTDTPPADPSDTASYCPRGERQVVPIIINAKATWEFPYRDEEWSDVP